MFPHTVLRFCSFVSSWESCEVYFITPLQHTFTTCLSDIQCWSSVRSRPKTVVFFSSATRLETCVFISLRSVICVIAAVWQKSMEWLVPPMFLLCRQSHPSLAGCCVSVCMDMYADVFIFWFVLICKTKTKQEEKKLETLSCGGDDWKRNIEIWRAMTDKIAFLKKCLKEAFG